jgi:hypothetical protein
MVFVQILVGFALPGFIEDGVQKWFRDTRV